jgi:uncharacterized protein YyaL (SSP411 family)
VAAPNRLSREKSPYLLQHARNPVDWRPWGEEAFAEARARAVPVFLSVGYSACHWCHVMERESFEDEEVAALLNAHFLPVKVDREELPAVDHLYMAFCQAMTGRGGWPLTVFTTPAGRPFFSGTYFPKQSGLGAAGMMEVLPQIARFWADRRDEILRTADGLLAALAGRVRAQAGPPPGPGAAAAACEALSELYDPRWGGFGSAPKFPGAPWLLLLLTHAGRGGDGRGRAVLEETLRAMRLGGIYDHVGYGFHRYSTDAGWLVPHFEKMLTDQALLLEVYAGAFGLWGEGGLRRTAAEIVEYVLREMRAPEGGFASAEDADSEGEEGRFYLWTTDEVAALLGPAADEFATLFHMRPNGNFRSETGGRSERNILHRLSPLALAASDFALPPEGLSPAMEEARRALLAARGRRARPLRDDKVLADWNGLMIAALARASALLGEPGWAREAAAAAGFVLGRLRDGAGGLLHRWRDGEAAFPATLDDHAFMARGCLELHAATGEARWLEEARGLADAMIARFRDPDGGGFFFAAADPLLPLRQKIAADGAVPSGNAVAVEVLARLARLTGQGRYREEAQAALAACGGDVEANPLGCAGLLAAAMTLEAGTPG